MPISALLQHIHMVWQPPLPRPTHGFDLTPLYLPPLPPYSYRWFTLPLHRQVVLCLLFTTTSLSYIHESYGYLPLHIPVAPYLPPLHQHIHQHTQVVLYLDSGVLIEGLLPHLNILLALFCVLIVVSCALTFYGSWQAEKVAKQAVVNSISQLLEQMLPPQISKRVMARQEWPICDYHVQASIMFADIVDFTVLSSNLPARSMIIMINTFVEAFDREAPFRRVEKIKTIGRPAHPPACSAPASVPGGPLHVGVCGHGAGDRSILYRRVRGGGVGGSEGTKEVVYLKSVSILRFFDKFHFPGEKSLSSCGRVGRSKSQEGRIPPSITQQSPTWGGEN